MITRSKKYSAIEILRLAFPEGVDVQTGKELEHAITEEDLKENPGLEKDVQVGDIVMLPEFVKIPVEAAFGKYQVMIGGIPNVSDPERKIITDGTEPLLISVGDTTAELEVIEEKVEE